MSLQKLEFHTWAAVANSDRLQTRQIYIIILFTPLLQEHGVFCPTTNTLTEAFTKSIELH